MPQIRVPGQPRTRHAILTEPAHVFSWSVFVAFAIPFLLLGFLAIMWSGLSVSTLRSQVARLLGERGSTPGAPG